MLHNELVLLASERGRHFYGKVVLSTGAQELAERLMCNILCGEKWAQKQGWFFSHKNFDMSQDRVRCMKLLVQQIAHDIGAKIYALNPYSHDIFEDVVLKYSHGCNLTSDYVKLNPINTLRPN